MKNFKLLLATTAILSTALAMNVIADVQEDVSVGADVILIKPYTVTSTDIHFPTFVAENNGTATMDINGNVTSAMTFVESTNTGVGVISGTGSSIGYLTSLGTEAVAFPKFSSNTIALKAVSSGADNDKPCGTVTINKKVGIVEDGVGAEYKYTGTLALASNVESFTEASVYCKGEATATLIMGTYDELTAEGWELE